MAESRRPPSSVGEQVSLLIVERMRVEKPALSRPEESRIPFHSCAFSTETVSAPMLELTHDHSTGGTADLSEGDLLDQVDVLRQTQLETGVAAAAAGRGVRRASTTPAPSTPSRPSYPDGNARSGSVARAPRWSPSSPPRCLPPGWGSPPTPAAGWSPTSSTCSTACRCCGRGCRRSRSPKATPATSPARPATSPPRKPPTWMPGSRPPRTGGSPGPGSRPWSRPRIIAADPEAAAAREARRRPGDLRQGHPLHRTRHARVLHPRRLRHHHPHRRHRGLPRPSPAQPWVTPPASTNRRAKAVLIMANPTQAVKILHAHAHLATTEPQTNREDPRQPTSVDR